MTTLLERVRRALAPDYDVERELAAGGMGHVFLAREPALGNRLVAVKVLRPERATAVNVDRFLREMRVLADASQSNPNVVTIHRRPGEKDGLSYFVMEYLEETLQQRLAKGPLTPESVLRLGVGLLAGLAKVHRKGVVHRDVKPSNIFFKGDVPVLGDFGIAKPSEGPEATPLTEDGFSPVTRAYAAPEQLAGGPVTPVADLYLVAMVLYEAVTGRRWSGLGEPADGDWHGVPAWLKPVLLRGLALEPGQRWPSAEVFADALRRAAPRRGPSWRPWAAAAAATVVIVGGYMFWPRQRSPDADVALLPSAAAPRDSGLAADIGRATWENLNNAFPYSASPRSTLRVTPYSVAEQWRGRPASDVPLPSGAWRDLHARRIARSRMEWVGDSVSISLEVLDPDGRRTPAGVVRGPVGDPGDVLDLGKRLAYNVVEVITPSRVKDFQGWLRGKSAAVLDTLMAGDRAFWSENWTAAEYFYRRAVALDSTLAQAWWGLYNVVRWSRETSDPADVVDIRGVLARYGKDLPSRDLLLMEADTALGLPRVAGYQRVIREFLYDAYPRLILGSELVHRGALMGIGPDSAMAVLRNALPLDSSLSPLYSTLAMPLIRLGDSAGARTVLDLYQHRVTDDFSVYMQLDLAWQMRFTPAAAWERVTQMLASSSSEGQSLAERVRFGLALGLPEAQRQLSAMLAASVTDPAAKASALVGQAVALVSLGRPNEALRDLDSAAAVVGHTTLGAELTLQAAEWRVLLPAVGVPGVSDSARDVGRAVLRRLAADSALGARAAWAGAVDAFSGADTAAGRNWLGRMKGVDSLTDRLRDLAQALRAAALGDTTAALRRTDALLPFAPNFRLGDPFARAVLYLRRGAWLAASGDARAAERVWMWYLNMDAAGWPQGAPQAGEIDWALENHGRYLRTKLASAAGDPQRACTLLRDVVTRWRDAEPAYAALRQDVADLMTPCAR